MRAAITRPGSSDCRKSPGNITRNTCWLAELCCQVVGVVRSLAREAPLRSLAVTGGHNLRSQSKNLSQVFRHTSLLELALIRQLDRTQEMVLSWCSLPTLQGVDVVVGTPGRINELMTKGALRLDHCRAVVLDEVDILLGALLYSCGPPRLD